MTSFSSLLTGTEISYKISKSPDRHLEAVDVVYFLLTNHSNNIDTTDLDLEINLIFAQTGTETRRREILYEIASWASLCSQHISQNPFLSVFFFPILILANVLYNLLLLNSIDNTCSYITLGFFYQ